jgi:predicted site-specific integrase-resolvase
MEESGRELNEEQHAKVTGVEELMAELVSVLHVLQ